MGCIETKLDESIEVREIYTKIFNKLWDKDIKELSKSLPIKLAREIKIWRIDKQYSWRGIAQLFVETYPEESKKLGIVSENQISGIQLCDAAMIKLKETLAEGWA